MEHVGIECLGRSDDGIGVGGEREGHHRKGGDGFSEGGREEAKGHRRNLGHFDRH